MRLHALAGAIALACLIAAPSVQAAAARPFPSATAERFSVEVRGHGPDIVLIPGLTSSRAVYEKTATQLEGRFRLHLVQVAGFGGEPAGVNASGPVLEPLVEALHAYIGAEKLRRPMVIGHSFGGLAGLMLADRHPEDVGKLLIVDSLPFFGALAGPQATVETVTPQAAAMRDTLAKASPETFAQMETRALAGLVKSEAGRRQALAWALASDPKVVGQAAYDDFTTDMRPRLGGIRTPVTLLYPWDASTGAPQAMFDQLYTSSYAQLPDKRVKRIDGAYHFIMLDRPDAFAAEIEGFVK